MAIRAMIWGLMGVVAISTPAWAEQTTWHFDSLKRVGSLAVRPSGAPAIVESPVGKAIHFNGQQDSLFIDGRPLVGASTFTIEMIFKPEGGTFQQRVMHIAETDPATGLDALPSGTDDPNPRFMFEVRVVGDQWFLDAFVNSKAGSKALAFRDKLHPIGKWYAVTQTYDGKTYRAYVDGVLQGEAEVAFVPHGPGHVRAGARMNEIDHFLGSIAVARFTDRAIQPAEFLKLPERK